MRRSSRNDNTGDFYGIISILQGMTFKHLLSTMATLVLPLPRGQGSSNGGGNNNAVGIAMMDNIDGDGRKINMRLLYQQC